MTATATTPRPAAGTTLATTAYGKEYPTAARCSYPRCTAEGHDAGNVVTKTRTADGKGRLAVACPAHKALAAEKRTEKIAASRRRALKAAAVARKAKAAEKAARKAAEVALLVNLVAA